MYFISGSFCVEIENTCPLSCSLPMLLSAVPPIRLWFMLRDALSERTLMKLNLRVPLPPS